MATDITIHTLTRIVKIFELNSAQGGNPRLHTFYEPGRLIRNN
jgi:hypothetical protein